MMKSSGEIGFTYVIEHVRDGKVLSTETVHNLVPTEGLNHVLSVAIIGGTAYNAWYVALYEGNFTPVAGTTMATVVSGATETTAYSEANRPTFVPGAISGGVVTNSASKAEFTFTSGKTIYGGFLSSNSVKQGTTGVLLSAVRFSTPKVVDAGDVLRVYAGLELTSA